MKWSVTTSKMFSKCQRKWYYFSIMASPRSTDPLRREAYLLKQLQSVYAWRGSLVDLVIQKRIVPEVKDHILPSENQVLDYAVQIMDKQISFVKGYLYDTFCYFYVEVSEDVSNMPQ